MNGQQQNPKPGTTNHKLETRYPKPKIRNSNQSVGKEEGKVNEITNKLNIINVKSYWSKE